MITTHCLYDTPLVYNGTPPMSNGDRWQFASSTCTTAPVAIPVQDVYNPTTTIASSSDIKLYGSFTAGEMINSILLLVIIFILLLTSLARSLDRVKTGKKFLQYNGGDVEIRDDL